MNALCIYKNIQYTCVCWKKEQINTLGMSESIEGYDNESIYTVCTSSAHAGAELWK